MIYLIGITGCSIYLLNTITCLSLLIWEPIIKHFVNLKFNLALLYNKGHNFWKIVLTWKLPQIEYFPTKYFYTDYTAHWLVIMPFLWLPPLLGVQTGYLDQYGRIIGL